MTKELPEIDFQRFWRRLQRIGLNAYEARSYLVLVGHPRFKALELAARSHVPRQKIYEVLDSLIEKGFAQVIQEKTKLFSAVEPSLAIPAYLARRSLYMAVILVLSSVGIFYSLRFTPGDPTGQVLNPYYNDVWLS